jgi:CheY-like chemotaxis protein
MKPGPKVLLVEDEPLLSELLTEVLTDKGFAVHASSNANCALNHLRSGADIDIMFTDIDLGEGMDGSELARIARQLRPSLPIVYASGRRSMDQFCSVPGSAFLQKPYTLNQVDATIARYLGTDEVVNSSRRGPETAPASGCGSRH